MGFNYPKNFEKIKGKPLNIGETRKLITMVKKDLLSGKKCSGYSSGDTVVFGIRTPKKIMGIYVTHDYALATQKLKKIGKKNEG